MSEGRLDDDASTDAREESKGDDTERRGKSSDDTPLTAVPPTIITGKQNEDPSEQS